MNQYMRRLWQAKVVKYDILKDYRETIPIEEQVNQSQSAFLILFEISFTSLMLG